MDNQQAIQLLQSTYLVIPDGQTKITLRPDETYWFHDGNVVIIARDGVAFRVYPGLLGAYSPVLRQRFQSAIMAEYIVDDLCLGRLGYICIDEPSEGFRHVLVWALRGAEAHRNEGLSETSGRFDEVFWCIRLGIDYAIPGLVAHGAQYLRRAHTPVRDEWLDMPDYLPPHFDPEHAIGVVYLTRLMNEPGLLPTAFFACTWLPASTLLRGIALPDGTRATLLKEDISRIINARSLLSYQRLAVARGVYAHPPASACHSAATGWCAQGLQMLRVRALKEQSEELSSWSVDPFATGLIQQSAALPHPYKLCQPCKEMLEMREQQWSQLSWALLPCIMDMSIPGWPNGIYQHNG
ncbi:hypothetical protein BD413DRAFT_610226 [Trametes elegans]|nr:hypothetical protein BD413DRAFT_610226 [Trametes elegans]